MSAEVDTRAEQIRPEGPVPHGAGPFRAFLLGRPEDPRWARPALWLLLVATAALYLIGLTKSGDANDFYAASVKSSTESLKAWLFASLDSANSITVDKPPAAMWVMGLSGRLFGFSSFSMLMPQALMGVGTVAVLHAAVRRTSGHGAALVAGVLVALTPVAAVMFRFNNPDALLVLLMTAAGYFVLRALHTDVARRAVGWLMLAGVALGFAFLTKMLQGLLVLPAFGLAYLWAARWSFWARIRHLLAAAAALVVSGGWFVALVALWPASQRPYVGGSTDNSLLELAIGYNGLGRIFGQSRSGGTARAIPTGGFAGRAGEVGAGGFGGGGFGGGGFGGAVPGRTGGGFTGGPGGAGFGGFGGQTGITRMFSSEFGTEISWLLPTALIILVAGFWFGRRAVRTDRIRASLILWGGAMVVSALVFSYMSGTIHPYYTVALTPFIAGTIAVGGRELFRGRNFLAPRLVLALALAAAAVWSFQLLRLYAPTWLPGLRFVVLIGGLLGAAVFALPAAISRRLGVVGLAAGSIFALSGTGAFTLATAAVPHTGSIPTAGPASAAAGRAGGAGAGRAGFGGGGFGGNTTADSALVAALDATTTRWSAAVSGSQTASPLILASHTAVMAIGGFSGSDPSPTLEQFQQYVAAGDISYFIEGGRGGPGGGNSAISTWVQQHYQSSTIGSSTVYDLRKATA